MTLAELMTTIESPRFRIETNTASDLRTFQRSVHQHPAVRQLVETLASPEAQHHVLNRILSLSRQSPDPRYENAADTPLSVYLVTLNGRDAELARVGAQVISEAKQCWWARAIADHIILGRNLGTSAADVITDVTFGRSRNVSMSQGDRAGDAVILAGLASGTGRQVTFWSKKVRINNELARAA